MDGQSFDIFLVHYAEGESEYEGRVKYTRYRKGGKFQNLFFVYQTEKEILEKYEAIFVMDDDIRISGGDIDRLFEIRKSLGLTILQPSFSRVGKVSHPITRMRAFTTLRYTNFVEVTCPLFASEFLFFFLDRFDPRANGGGVDFWFCDEARKQNAKIAIVDEICCVNPHDKAKGGGREIDLFQSRAERNRVWAAVRKDLGLTFPENQFVTYRAIYKFDVSQIANYLVQILKCLYSMCVLSKNN